MKLEVPLVNVTHVMCVHADMCVVYKREKHAHSRGKRKPLSISSILSNSRLIPLRQGLFSHCCESSMFRLVGSKLSGSTCLCSLSLDLPHDYFQHFHMGAEKSSYAECVRETIPLVVLGACTESTPIHQAIYVAP